jgi:hypothetical protein
LLPVDIVDDAPHRLRFPRFVAQDGEMLAFAHIPTGTHTPATKIYSFGKKRNKSGCDEARHWSGGHFVERGVRTTVEKQAPSPIN